jgi:predicted trehalose synthase
MRQGQTLTADAGRLEFRTVEGEGLGFEMAEVVQARPMGAEQSNTSIVFGDEHVLKLYRRLEAGPNPELEVLRALAAAGFANAPRLEGALTTEGPPLETALASVIGLVPAAGGGWELTLESFRDDPSWLPERAWRLGEVTAGLHAALAASDDDPHFAPEEPSAEALALLAAEIEEEIATTFASLPADDALGAVAHRAEDLRDLVQELAAVGPAGLAIRTHGDYHLGQVLWADGDWVLLDFEGEPARSLPERRRKRSPLRDVAGMLRSFAYAASAAGVEPGWEQRARGEFLDGYLGAIDQRVIPSGDALDRVLAIFELEKAIYELGYELDNRPDWVHIPVAGIQRLLEEVPA